MQVQIAIGCNDLKVEHIADVRKHTEDWRPMQPQRGLPDDANEDLMSPKRTRSV